MTTTLRTLLAACPVAIAIVAFGADATSDTPAPEAGTPTSCVPDTQKLCSTVRPGGGRVLECLAKNKDKLAPACKQAMVPIAQPVLEWRAVCGVDIDNYCAPLPPSLGLVNCLRAHKATLAPSCQAKIDDASAQVRLACVQEAQTLCKDVTPGGGRLIECLEKQSAQLGQGCRNVVNVAKSWVLPWRAACGTEIDTHCTTADNGWEILACLDKNREKASQSCKDKLNATAARFQALCGFDINKYCADVPPGEGRIVTCLHQHRTSLRPACKAVVP